MIYGHAMRRGASRKKAMPVFTSKASDGYFEEKDAVCQFFFVRSSVVFASM